MLLKYLIVLSLPRPRGLIDSTSFTQYFFKKRESNLFLNSTLLHLPVGKIYGDLFAVGQLLEVFSAFFVLCFPCFSANNSRLLKKYF